MNGQEKDVEIAEGIYTAEFWEYDSRTGRRWNQDPKPNPSISNYAAFANNPIWFSDPLGDTLKINGTEASKAFSMLQQASDLTLKRDAGNGIVSAEHKIIGPLTQNDQILMNATQDMNIMVNVDATDKNRVSENGPFFMSGAFSGNTNNAGIIEGKVNATQVVNPNHMKIKEDFLGGAPGITMMHETIEAYIGSVDSPGATPNSNEYKSAHSKANSADVRRANIPFNYKQEIKNFNAKTGYGDIYIYIQNANKEVHLLYTNPNVKLR